VKELLTAGLLLLGAAFMLLAAVGIVRMPDLFTRMQPATKAATLGLGCMFTAVAVHFADLGITSRALAAFGFVVITAPVAAHVIGRAAYFVGVSLWEGTTIDELRGRHDAEGQAPPDAGGASANAKGR
jgi:multicomponent Na+:H+ antiporter subunit G